MKDMNRYLKVFILGVITSLMIFAVIVPIMIMEKTGKDAWGFLWFIILPGFFTYMFWIYNLLEESMS